MILPDIRKSKKEQNLGKPSFKKSAVFLNIVQTGGVKPMFKNYVVNFV